MAVGFLSASAWTGCSKKAQVTTDPAAAYQQVPQAASILSAMEKKDYEAAMSSLLQARAAAQTEEQQNAVTALTMDIKGKLIDASVSDPKAADALQALRFATTGR